MRVSERGQVTIPKKIREQFGLGTNTEVEFVVRDGHLELVPARKSRRKKSMPSMVKSVSIKPQMN